MSNPNLDNIVLALLFSADEPISVRKMAAIVEDVSAADIKSSVENWRRRIDEEGWSISIEQVAGGYQLSSRPEYAQFIARLYSKKRKFRLSRAALETLAIISYKQPITRADIEGVRGVGCGGVISNLLERSLIKITGKAKVLGAPFLYGTTPEFLEYLGLNSLKDLPSHEELEALLEKEALREDDADAGAEEAGDAEIEEAETDDGPEETVQDLEREAAGLMDEAEAIANPFVSAPPAGSEAGVTNEPPEEEPLPWEQPPAAATLAPEDVPFTQPAPADDSEEGDSDDEESRFSDDEEDDPKLPKTSDRED